MSIQPDYANLIERLAKLESRLLLTEKMTEKNLDQLEQTIKELRRELKALIVSLTEVKIKSGFVGAIVGSFISFLVAGASVLIKVLE